MKFNVEGMTCSHCAQTLTTVLSALSGVENVDVDVTSGRVILDVLAGDPAPRRIEIVPDLVTTASAHRGG